VPTARKPGRRTSSFGTQRDDRINRHRPPRRHVAREGGDDEEQQRHGEQCRRIGRTHLEEQRRQAARHHHREPEPDRGPEPGKRETVTQDQTEDVGSRSAERHPHADVARLLDDTCANTP